MLTKRRSKPSPEGRVRQISQLSSRSRAGKVWLVGAGPGSPDLLTIRALRLLQTADVIAYDELVTEEIVALAKPSAERIAVGRRANGCKHHNERIHPAVIARARQGLVVVRLKGGDPLVFGRGGEEAEELSRAGIAFEIVPGISAALGAAAACGIPLTHRAHSRSVTFATAHAATDSGDPTLALTVPLTGTVVLYMGLGRLAQTAAELIAAGRSPSTPAAAIASATRSDQRVVVGTLATLERRVAEARLQSPTIVVVGEVVAHSVVPSVDAAPSLRVAIGA